MTCASFGIWTSLRLPIAVMTPLEVTTTASASGGASGVLSTLPPVRTSVCAFAATPEEIAKPKRKRKSAVRRRFPIKPKIFEFCMVVVRSVEERSTSDQTVSDRCELALIVLAPSRTISDSGTSMPRRQSFLRRVLDRIESVGLETEQVPGLQHMRRQRRAGIDHAAARMRNHDPARQEMQAV